ncbi:hypothetical protein BC831DRAFT_403533 [Entophlyctis helioformis]|nr:hypothetical protein BC831DRAFT_403533 [Entophlyctis helioformis]
MQYSLFKPANETKYTGGSVTFQQQQLKDQTQAASDAAAPVKTKVPSRPAARADKPKAIRGVPFVQYVLVGGGTASYSAMEAIREAQPDAQVLIIAEEDFVPYQRPPLSKELWFGETSADLKFTDWQGNESSLFYLPKESYSVMKADDLGKIGEPTSKIQLLSGVSVVKINPEDQTVVLSNGKRVQYGRVLVATGGSPKNLPALEKATDDTKSRILTFRGIKDFKRLDSIAQGEKTIAIVGGGFLGSELAIALCDKGVKVVQLFPEDGNMGLVFPRYLTKWTTSKLRQAGVDVRSNSDIETVVKKGEKVEIKVKGGAAVEADYVIVAVGLAPNEDLARESGLELDPVRGGITVNAELEARTNVFAAGDVTSFHDIALGRRRVEHYDHAVMSGRMAGFNMTGAKKPYTHQSMFWSDLGPDVSYEAVGLIDSKLPTVGVWAKVDAAVEKPLPEKEVYGRGVVFYLTPERKVVGVLAWNLPGKMDIARKIIREGKAYADVDSLSRLFNVHGN